MVIDSHSDLSLEDENLKAEGESVSLVPLCQIREILISTLQASMSSALICELNRRNISVIFCNSKKNPCAVLSPLETERRFSAGLHKQIAWDGKLKEVKL